MRRMSFRATCLASFLVFCSSFPRSWAGDVKADLDADLSRDGVINDDDPRDNGAVQEKPPGLPVTIGVLEPIVLRCEPRNWATGYVRLTVVSNPGEWKRLKDPGWLARPRRPAGGHIRVWREPEKTRLVLDSQNPAKMTMIWRLTYASPMALVPPTLFVEGVAASREDGDVVLVLEYGPTSETTGPESTRDILAMAVRPAAKPPLTRRVAKGEGGGGDPVAEQLAIWTFDGTPSFRHGVAINPTTEDVDGTPTVTMHNADIIAAGVPGKAYTDVEGTAHAASLAAAWKDLKKSDAPDADFWVAMATTGWKSLSVRFDYQCRSARACRIKYSLDGGTNWSDAAANPIALTVGLSWHSLGPVALDLSTAIENVPDVLFRFYDFDDTGNDELYFDNLEFIGTRLPPPGAPTICAAPTTTADLRLEAVNEGYVGGVMADPTDPARTLGLDFVIAKPGTPAEQLTVAATAPTDRVTLQLTGTGANRNLKITPLLVGYTDIDVTVSDGTATATYRVRYAASAAAVDPAGPRFHAGVSDVSAATAVDADTILAANDEDRSIWRFRRDASGLFRKQIDTAPWLALTSLRETDVEGCARDGNRVYWIGSHGNNTDGTLRQDRHRLFATTLSGTGDQTELAYVGRYDNLRADLVSWDVNNLHGKGANYYGLAVSVNGLEPKRIDGFNIEGLAMGDTGSTVYVGLRAPIVPASNRTRALVVPVTNVQTLVGGNPGPGPARFGPPLEWDMGGRGVRSIARTTSGGYLIVAGSPLGVADFRLYSWSGKASDQPVLLGTDLAALGAPGSFEAIVEPAGGVSGTVQLLSDCGTADWYGDGQESKALNPNWQKFRSDWVNTGTGGGAFSFTMGGRGAETAWSVVRTRDGGSILLGSTTSSGAGKSDLWVAKVDTAGGIEWQHTYGGANDDGSMTLFERPSIRQTPDGGYLVVGTTWSFGAGSCDIWVLRLTPKGETAWQQAYGGPKGESGIAAALCADGTIAVVGTTGSFGAEGTDIWALRLTGTGGILWQAAYGSVANESNPLLPSTENARGIEELPGGDLLVTGNGRDAPLLLRLGPDGALRWAVAYGEAVSTLATDAIVPTADGGCVAASGDLCSVQRLDGSGNPLWSKVYQGTHTSGADEAWLSHAWAIAEMPDHGYIVGTFCLRPIFGPLSSASPALLRVDGDGNPLWCRSYIRISRAGEVPGFAPDTGDYLRERFCSLSVCPDGSVLVCGKSPVTYASGRDMVLLRTQADGTLPGYSAALVEVEAAKPTSLSGGPTSIARRVTNGTAVATDAVPADTDFAPGRPLP